MKEIINEYGSMVLAVTGLILFFGTMGAVVLSRSGLLMQMIQTWMYGGNHATIWTECDCSRGCSAVIWNYWWKCDRAIQVDLYADRTACEAGESGCSRGKRRV